MNVSRETQSLLDQFQNLVLKWDKSLNLIATSPRSQISTRHIQDSLNLVSICEETEGRWVDLGSGGGFPGVVVAISKRQTPLEITLIEADRRKCVFLQEVRRRLGLQFSIRAERIEAVPALSAEIISARALAPLPELLALAVPHGKKQTRFLFPKGQNWSLELENARKSWHFTMKHHPSPVEAGSTILELTDVSYAS